MAGQRRHLTGLRRLAIGIELLSVGHLHRQRLAGAASPLQRSVPLSFAFAASASTKAAGALEPGGDDGNEQCQPPDGPEGASCHGISQAERRYREKKVQLNAAVAKAKELEQELRSAREVVERLKSEADEAELSWMEALGEEESTGPALSWRSVGYESSKSGKGSIYGGRHTVEMFAKAGYSDPVEDDSWDVLFTHFPMANALKELDLPPRQGRVIHNCEYFTAAGQKCDLARHVAWTQSKRKLSGSKREDGPRYLTTYELRQSDQADAWISQLEADPKRYWLVKACVGGRSQAVTLVNGEQMAQAKLSADTWSVAQEYIQHPFMGFGGRKFHLRMYLLVTTWHPVAAFLYNEGIIFRSLLKYESKQPSSSRDIFSGISDTVEPLAFRSLWDALGANRSAKVWADTVEMLAELLGDELEHSFGDASQLSQRGFECFDLLGADVMLDGGLRPLLLEINTGPDMWVRSHGPEHEALLREVKGPLLEQLAQWAGLRSQLGRDGTRPQAEELERRALLNFTRIAR